MQPVLTTRENVCLLLEQCNVPYKVMPLDEKLYQECIDDGRRRGYPMDNARTRAYLPVGITYAANAGGHIPHRPIQIWIGLYTTFATIIDDIPENHLQDMADVYQFNDRFVKRERQGNDILETFADLIRRATNFYHPVAAQLIITSSLNFVAANLLEHETKAMKISSAAQQYAAYQRTLSGVAEAYSFMIFWKEVPLNNYIQSIPELTVFIQNVNDVLSFYKEELIGDPTNQISTLAARTRKSKLEVLSELTEQTINMYSKIVQILEDSPVACGAFKNYTAGYVYFHTSLVRYRMNELDL